MTSLVIRGMPDDDVAGVVAILTPVFAVGEVRALPRPISAAASANYWFARAHRGSV